MTSMDQQLDASFCLSLLVLNIQPDLCMSNVIGKRRASHVIDKNFDNESCILNSQLQ